MRAPSAATAIDRESSIVAHGQDLITSYQSGDREAAVKHQAAMLDAIRQQPAAIQRQRFTEIDRAIAFGAGCYFTERGDADRLAMGCAP